MIEKTYSKSVARASFRVGNLVGTLAIVGLDVVDQYLLLHRDHLIMSRVVIGFSIMSFFLGVNLLHDVWLDERKSKP